MHALEVVKPDAVLVEGPPDADELIPLVSRPGLEPPVALLIYVPQRPRSAVLYPFARFSPEWQAIQYALAHGLPVRFMDLPQSLQLSDGDPADTQKTEDDSEQEALGDPLAPVAQAAGYSDVERWWDHLVESRNGQDIEVFTALREMMSAVREHLEIPLRERRREAYMRKCIRQARVEGYSNIAVVCGAFHAPALQDLSGARDDDALLKGLPKAKTAAAWVPWTYERLSYRSGYGAGVESPAWYELLWEKRKALGAEWLTRAARLLREEDIPISSAHVIEACRLADALAAIRGRPVPGLVEYNDAAISVLGHGDATNLKIIQHRWHFGARLGKVPEDFPAAPLQQDLAAQQKRLRFPPKAEEKVFDFDLRETTDRERGHLLRRLRLLGIEWGIPVQHAGGRGTFHEVWQVQWQPEFAIALIEASRYGHTIESAAAAMIRERAAGDAPLGTLVALLEDALFADLPDGIGPLVAAIENRAALAADVLQLVDALVPLINVHRYGNVRETDVSLVAEILDGLVPRILIAVPRASVNVDDDAARTLWQKLFDADRALATLANDEFSGGWREMLGRLAASESTHPLLNGFAYRLLYDARAFEFEELAKALSRALSPGTAPAAAAAWIEGFLSGSGAILIHDDGLRGLINDWVRSVSSEHFVQILPLLRRTFARFPRAERRLIGERLRAGDSPASTVRAVTDFDEGAARRAMSLLKLIWGKGEAS